MRKFIEVVAKSNYETLVIIKNEVEENDDLEVEITHAMRRIKGLNTSGEKFIVVSVKAMDIKEGIRTSL